MASRHNLDFLVRPAVLIAVVAVIAMWDRRPMPRIQASGAPVVQEQPEAPKMSAEQVRAAGDRCTRSAGTEFRRAWNQGTVSTDAWTETAEYASHYNAKLDSCFYLLTIVRRLPATLQDVGPVVLIREMLFDIGQGELYGEYRGPEAIGTPGAQLPDVCRMAGFYCASRREWGSLAEPFMEPRAGSP